MNFIMIICSCPFCKLKGKPLYELQILHGITTASKAFSEQAADINRSFLKFFESVFLLPCSLFYDPFTLWYSAGCMVANFHDKWVCKYYRSNFRVSLFITAKHLGHYTTVSSDWQLWTTYLGHPSENKQPPKHSVFVHMKARTSALSTSSFCISLMKSIWNHWSSWSSIPFFHCVLSNSDDFFLFPVFPVSGWVLADI